MKKGLIIRIIIGLLLLSLFIIWAINFVKELNEFKIIHELDIGIIEGIKALFFSNSIIKPILLLLALIGVFTKNNLGWILIASFFYFAAFDIIILLPTKSYIGVSLITIILVLVIFLMNLNKIREEYRISRNRILIANMVPIIVSLALIYLKGYHLLNNSLSIYEIMERIK